MKYELNRPPLLGAANKRTHICKHLQTASVRTDRAASQIEGCGEAYGMIAALLNKNATSIRQLSIASDRYLAALEKICNMYDRTDRKICSLSTSASASPDGKQPADHGESASFGRTEKETPQASIAPEPSVKTKSSDDDPLSDSNHEEVNLPKAVEEATGQRPPSPATFSVMDAAGKSAYLSTVASQLLKAYPKTALSTSSRVEIPLGRGMSAYSTVSVSGSRGSSDHAKISMAMDANTGILKENISVSNDGTTISYTKDGISVSVKTDTGTWKVDPSSLSRTVSAQLDENTRFSFTEKVDAKGYSSVEQSVIATIEGTTVSTAIGLKTTTSDNSNPASPVPVPAKKAAQAQKERLSIYEKILSWGLIGEVLSGTPAPVPVPVF